MLHGLPNSSWADTPSYVVKVDPWLVAKVTIKEFPESTVLYKLRLFYGTTLFKTQRVLSIPGYKFMSCSITHGEDWVRFGSTRKRLCKRVRKTKRENWVIVEVATGVVIQNSIWTPDVAEYLQSILWVC